MMECGGVPWAIVMAIDPSVSSGADAGTIVISYVKQITGVGSVTGMGSPATGLSLTQAW